MTEDEVRQLLLGSLGAFCCFFEDTYALPTHIKQLHRTLRGVESGEAPLCVITMPPRSGKSLTTSQLFPCWYLARHPRDHVLLATYGQSFAEKFGRYARNLMRSPDFVRLFPESAVPRDSSSITHFYTASGGSFRSTSVGGVTSGLPADLFIIDDPHKDRAEVMSDKKRESVHEWFRSAAYVRLTPTGKMAVLQTRWHEDDLAGRLLTTEPDKWRLVSFPAILPDGSSYWPSARPLPYLEDIKKTIGSYEFAALYMQEPTPREGGMFKKEWFEVTTPPMRKDILDVIRYWDRAATVPTGSSDPDYTVGVKVCKTRDGVFYVLDVVRVRDTAHKVQKKIKETAGLDGHGCRVGIEQDPGQAGVFEAQYIARELAGYNVKLIRPTGSKELRAEPVAAQAEARNIKVAPGKWHQEFFDELCSFPFGKHDDIVDAFTGAVNFLIGSGYSLAALGR